MSVLSQANPVWTGATPSDLGSQAIKDVSFDRTSIKPPIGAYTLASDGTDSEFRYTPDSFAKPVIWQPGAPFSDVYSIMRSASTPGSVLAYAPSSVATGSVNITYNAGSGPASANVGDTIILSSTLVTAGTDPPGTLQEIDAVFSDCVSVTITAVSGFTPWSINPNPPTETIWVYFDCAGNPVLGPVAPTSSTLTDLVPNTNLSRYAAFGNNDHPDGLAGVTFTVSMKINSLIFPGGNSEVRYSSDYGATVGSAVTVGTSPGINGVFDLLPIGDTSIAAAQGQVKIATTLGGSYSNTPSTGGTLASGNPVALVLPVRTLPHGSRQDYSATPDFIMGADADNSGASLWMVTGAGSRTDITPVSGCTIAPRCVTSWQTASTLHIQAIINDGGVYKLYSYDGSTWTFRRTVSDPRYLRYKRFGNAIFYMIDGSTLVIGYSHGARLLTRTLPTSNPGVSLDIYD